MSHFQFAYQWLSSPQAYIKTFDASRKTNFNCSCVYSQLHILVVTHLTATYFSGRLTAQAHKTKVLGDDGQRLPSPSLYSYRKGAANRAARIEMLFSI